MSLSRAGLAALSGILLVGALPPFPTTPLAWLGLVPLAVVVRDAGVYMRGAAGTRRRWLPPEPWRLGLIFGFTHQMLLLRWIPGTVALTNPALGWPFLFILAGTLAMMEATAFVGMATAYHRFRLPLPLAVGVPWVALEWVRAHLGGFSFPWGGLALGLTGMPAALAPAEWVGERGVALWLAATSGWVATVLAPAVPASRRVWSAVGAVALVGVPVVLGGARLADLPTRDLATVMILQPDIATSLRADSASAIDTALVRIRRLVSGPHPSADLRVAPEVVVPSALDRDGALVRRLLDLTGEVPMVLGAFATDPNGGRYNAAWVIDIGLADGHWEKTRLVPGWERTPGLGGGLLDRRGIEPGRQPAGGVRAAGTEWGVLICFESLFGGLARAHVRAGAQGLLSLTNDAWFTEAGAAGRAASEQHLAHLVLRAIETRTGIVRAANTGISAIIQPGGAVEHRLGVGVEGVTVGAVRRVPGRTLYVQTGDWVGALSILTVLVGLLWCVGTGFGRRHRPT